ncbi:MAG: MFS transporter [Chloroflexota bacterium]
MSGIPTTGLNSQRWRHLLPIAFITYSFAYLDRSNYSLGAAGGLKASLHITAGAAGLLGGLFFLGYFFFQIPAAHYAENRSVKKLMFWSLLFWGVFASAQGIIPWLWLLMVDRFLLGVVEAAVIPSMLIFLAHWFSSEERGRANTFLILGNPVTVLWMSAVSGYLISITSWQWMFIIEGLPAIAWAFVFRALVEDRPRQADWLPVQERQEIETALAEDQRGMPKVSSYVDAFKQRNVVLLSIQYALWSIGVYGFVFWLPTIIKLGSHRGIAATGLLSAVPYALAAILMLVASVFSDRSGKRKVYVWPFLLGGALAFYGSFLIGNHSFLGSYVLLILAAGMMYAPYGPFFALITDLLPQNVAGAAVALVNSFGALGGFVGAYVVGYLVGSGGKGSAFLFMGASLAAAAILVIPVARMRAFGTKSSTADLDPGSSHAQAS